MAHLGAPSAGESPLRVLFVHIVPNLIPSMLVLYSLAVGGGIVVESTLRFLGLGEADARGSRVGSCGTSASRDR